jgi:hypothetical protein
MQFYCINCSTVTAESTTSQRKQVSRRGHEGEGNWEVYRQRERKSVQYKWINSEEAANNLDQSAR